MKVRLLAICFFILFCWSCEDDEPAVAKDVEQSLNEILVIMEKYSINRYTIDWTDFRNKVFEKVKTIRNVDQKRAGIREALNLLGDNHSFFQSSTGEYIAGDHERCETDNILSHSLPDNIGYVKVLGFNQPSIEDAAIEFAREIQDQISQADHPELLGWIVDLRENHGGNMWPMLAGIGPILGEGIVGHFVDPDNNETVWRYEDGASKIGGQTMIKLDDPYELINPNPKVAVLIGPEIGSSGEAVVISFIGPENTRSFGSATCGLSTANSGFKLSDNSTLFLTVSYMADRNLNQYGGKVLPDEEASPQEIIQKAVDWIEN